MCTMHYFILYYNKTGISRGKIKNKNTFRFYFESLLKGNICIKNHCENLGKFALWECFGFVKGRCVFSFLHRCRALTPSPLPPSPREGGRRSGLAPCDRFKGVNPLKTPIVFLLWAQTHKKRAVARYTGVGIADRSRKNKRVRYPPPHHPILIQNFLHRLTFSPFSFIIIMYSCAWHDKYFHMCTKGNRKWQR